MKRILIATDFSTRSDRALRRATLLARRAGAELVLVHVVDDDQPARILKSAKREAAGLLEDLARGVRETDGVACTARVSLGDPFEAIGQAAVELDADLVVMGPHRRQILRDVFVGTTVERTIRRSHGPVIMANALPAGPYRRVLIATDLSEGSALAAGRAGELGLLDGVEVLVLHAFDAPAQSMMRRASLTAEQLKDNLAEQEERADAELTAFLQRIGLEPSRRILRFLESSVAQAIRQCAREHRADLVVAASHGRTGSEKMLLGSVVEQVLRDSEVDVLVVPPVRTASIPPGR